MLFSVERVADKLVDSLITMVRMSPTSCALRSEKTFLYLPPSAHKDWAETAGASVKNKVPAANAPAICFLYFNFIVTTCLYINQSPQWKHR